MTTLTDLIQHIEHKFMPELVALKGIIQDATHHPEGDAYIHTLLVVEAAENIAERENLSQHRSSVLINAALTHDLGKATTTEIHDDGRITAYGHPKAGIEPANNMLSRLGVELEVIAEILPLVGHHMDWVGFYTPDITDRAVKRLARRLMPTTIEMWALLVEADMSGRPPLPAGLPRKAYDILVLARELGVNDGVQVL